MARGFWMAHRFSTAHSSTAVTPFTSVAVVTTAAPPVRSATRRASRFAPPMCPDRMGITKCPASSVTTTAGSCVLARTQGAMARTAMPHAQTKTIAPAR